MAINSDYICKVKDDLYTSSTLISAENDYALSLDFGDNELSQLLNILPSHLSKELEEGLKCQPYMLQLHGEEFQFGVESLMTEDIIHNNEESYLPFQVTKFMPYIDFCE